MKGVIIAGIAVIVIVAAGIAGLPLLMDKYVAPLREDVQNVKQRLQKIEDESKVAPLQPTADTAKIIKTINVLALQVGTLESSLKKDITGQTETIQKQKAEADEAFKKQAETIDKNYADVQAKLQGMKFNETVEDIRAHVLKARVEVVAKNLGNAKTEIDFIDELFTRIIPSAHDEQKQTVEDIRVSLRKAKAEIDTDLPSFINRLNTVWFETGKLLR